jgi:hypothetical protein
LLTKVFFCDFLPERWRIVLKNRISARIYYNVLKIWQKVLEIFAERRACFQFLAGERPPILPPPLIGKPGREVYYSTWGKNIFINFFSLKERQAINRLYVYTDWLTFYRWIFYEFARNDFTMGFKYFSIFIVSYHILIDLFNKEINQVSNNKSVKVFPRHAIMQYVINYLICLRLFFEYLLGHHSLQ